MNYAWGLEFIELVNDENAKGFHGNAVFSRWPIRRAGVIRLPEQYNWYFDRQKRIGGRLAVYAELDVVVSRWALYPSIWKTAPMARAARRRWLPFWRPSVRELPDMPLILGGDLNTNTFDGRAKEDIGAIAADPALRRRCLEDVGSFEPLLPLCAADGYEIVPKEPRLTAASPCPTVIPSPAAGLDPAEGRHRVGKPDDLHRQGGSHLCQARLRSGTLSGGRAVGPQCRLGHVPPSLIFFLQK